MTPPDYDDQFDEIHESGRPSGGVRGARQTGNGGAQGPTNVLPYEWSASLKPELEVNDFVEGVLTEGCLAVAYGDSGVGKSFWAIDLGLHLSAGIVWNGRETDQGIVIYISLEGGRLTKNRVIKAREKLELPPDIPFVLVTCPLDMRTSDADAERLANTIRQVIRERSGQYLPVRLVIIDTLSRALNGGAENAEDMGLLLKHADFVRRETGVALLFIAHCGKDAAKGIRGWSGIRAAIDVEIEVSKANGQTGHVAHITKERDLEEGDCFGFSLKQVDVGLNSRGRMVTTCVVVHAEDAGTPAAAAAAKAKAATKDPWRTQSLQVLREALTNVLATKGQEYRPWPDGSTFWAANLDDVRKEFYHLYPAAEAETPKQRGDVRRCFQSGHQRSQAQEWSSPHRHLGCLRGRSHHGVVYLMTPTQTHTAKADANADVGANEANARTPLRRRVRRVRVRSSETRHSGSNSAN